MNKKNWLSTLALSGLLMACALPPNPSPTPSLVPTVNCNEAAPSQSIPAYPKAPENETLDTLRLYASAQIEWAAVVLSAFTSERILRAGTRNCLADLRSKQLIN